MLTFEVYNSKEHALIPHYTVLYHTILFCTIAQATILYNIIVIQHNTSYCTTQYITFSEVYNTIAQDCTTFTYHITHLTVVT